MSNTSEALHVAVGVITNPQGQVLIAKRPTHVHQGDLWEFPGGKLEPGEDVQMALRRELQEELDIQVQSCRPLGTIRYAYPERTVLLDIHRVDAFAGEPRGREGQPIKWVDIEQLRQHTFPAANQGIIHMLELPDYCLITGKFASIEDFENKLRVSLQHGIRLVQLRAKELEISAQIDLAKKALDLCQEYEAKLLLNPSLGHGHGVDVAGVQLTSQQLFEFDTRPVASDKLLSASVHNASELRQAEKLQADFVLLSPVLPTASHPDAEALGWENFQQLVKQAHCPVYALGGVNASHLQQARACGAHGIAAISAFWGAAS
jgi:8-oxo-dGTP diphosphatase